MARFNLLGKKILFSFINLITSETQEPWTKLRPRPNATLEKHNVHTDLLSFQNPPKFLSNFKNPCYLLTLGNTTQNLRCLPYYFIVGFPKSGTTDVWNRLLDHPDIIGKHNKEPNFYRKGMLGRLYNACVLYWIYSEGTANSNMRVC